MKSDMSGITVAVPSYNHEAFVERTLRSIFNQSLRPETLIVIDDGSKDESAKIIKAVLSECPFEHTFISRGNRGLCRTLNEALSLARGDHFAYISSDDVWLPAFLESRMRTFEKRPNAVLAYGYSYLIDEQDRIFDSTQNWGGYVDGNATDMLLTPTIPASASVLYRRDVLGRFGWNGASILEDYELYLRFSRAGDFAFDPNILSACRIHGGNTSADFPKMVDEWLGAQRRVANEIGLSEAELEQIQRKVRFNCISSFIRHGHKGKAARLLWESGSSASPAAVGEMILRLMVPGPLLRWRRGVVKRRMIESYGKLNY